MNRGFGSVESTVPSFWKSQANVIESPGSSSTEPSLLNCTVSGAWPFLGVALTTACGRCGPFVYSHRYMPASALGWKKPSP